MKALTWHGKSDIPSESGADPKIRRPKDAIIKGAAGAICGSDLHIFEGAMPSMEVGRQSTSILKVGLKGLADQ